MKGVTPSSVLLKPKDAPEEEVDCGLVVWAAGNTLRKLTRDLMGKVGEQVNKRGLVIDGGWFLRPYFPFVLWFSALGKGC